MDELLFKCRIGYCRFYWVMVFKFLLWPLVPSVGPPCPCYISVWVPGCFDMFFFLLVRYLALFFPFLSVVLDVSLVAAMATVVSIDPGCPLRNHCFRASLVFKWLAAYNTSLLYPPLFMSLSLLVDYHIVLPNLRSLRLCWLRWAPPCSSL